MLLDPNAFTRAPASHRGAAPIIPADLETKSADVETKADRASRFKPRRTTADRVREALLTLAEGAAELLTHEETAWASITFSGTRHEVVLDFAGSAAVAAGEEYIANLPEHEFRIPSQLVAEATVTEVDHRFGEDERLIVKAVLLLLEEA